MADDKVFSHITVSAEDEDDFVIQAGAPAGANAASRKKEATKPPFEEHTVAEGKQGRPSEVEFGGEPHKAHAASAAPGSARSMPSKPHDPYRETKLEDLQNTSMPTMQKVVLVAALLLVLGFIVYYIFLR